MGPSQVPKTLEHIHVYDDKGFRCIECGHEINKGLENKIRNYPGELTEG